MLSVIRVIDDFVYVWQGTDGGLTEEVRQSMSTEDMSKYAIEIYKGDNSVSVCWEWRKIEPEVCALNNSHTLRGDECNFGRFYCTRCGKTGFTMRDVCNEMSDEEYVEFIKQCQERAEKIYVWMNDVDDFEQYKKTDF